MITMWIHRHTMVGSWGEDGRKYHSFVSPFEASLPERGCEIERERERERLESIQKKKRGGGCIFWVIDQMSLSLMTHISQSRCHQPEEPLDGRLFAFSMIASLLQSHVA